MRPKKRAASGQIAGAASSERLFQRIRALDVVAALDQGQSRGWKGRCGVLLRRHQGSHGAGAVGLHLRAGLGHAAFERGIPMGVAHHVFQQAITLAHGFVISQRRLGMAGHKTECRTVKKPPSPFGAFDPKPVHRRHKPKHAQHICQCSLGYGFAV